LLAKEAAESKARLESLSSNEYREVKASRIGGGDIRRRQLGDIASILEGRPKKRKRVEEPKKNEKESRRVNTSSEDEEPVVRVHDDKTRSRRQLGDIAAILKGQSNKRRRTENHKTENRSRRAIASSDEEHEDTKSRHRTEDSDKSKIHRSRHRPEEERRSRTDDRERRRNMMDDRENDDRRRRHRETSKERRYDRRRSRSRSPKEHRSWDSRRRDRSPNQKRERSTSSEPDNTRHRSHRHRRSPSPVEDKKETPHVDYDSDPLDDIIGPRPPPVPQLRSRGRGAISDGSGMDSRFSASYDPTVDVQLDPDEENDWDQALEALRDRQKWKQQGADRLRAAGFTDEEVKKWEKGGEKREEDVKWSKRGESREWDRGKIIDVEGTVSLESSWGRLKGS